MGIIKRLIGWFKGWFSPARRLDAAPRSTQWPTVRKHFLAEHQVCAVCGSEEQLQVHHVTPFALDKTKELDPENLIVLCEKNNCHLMFGHLGSYRSYNPNVRKDAAAWAEKIRKRPPIG